MGEHKQHSDQSQAYSHTALPEPRSQSVVLAHDRVSKREGMPMAENSSGGGNAGLASIVGGLVVVVAVLAWFLLGRGGASDTKNVDVEVKLPEVSAPAAPSGPEAAS